MVEHEAQHQESADVMTEQSELEKKVEEIQPQDEKAPEKIECLCVHGTCAEGQSNC